MGGVERWLLSTPFDASLVVGGWEVETKLLGDPGEEAGDLCVGNRRLSEGIEREKRVCCVCVCLFHSESLTTLEEAEDSLNVVAFSPPVLPDHQWRA